MRLQAMHEYTARLPLVELNGQTLFWVIPHSMLYRRCGPRDGHGNRRNFSTCQKCFGEVSIVMTGGDADFLAERLECRYLSHPNWSHKAFSKS